jgi:hypothetical protein
VKKIIDRVLDDSTYVHVPAATGPHDRLCVTLESDVQLYFALIVRGTQQERLMVLERTNAFGEQLIVDALRAYQAWRPTTTLDSFKMLFYVWKEGERYTHIQPRIGQSFCLFRGDFSDQSINTDAYTLPGGTVVSIEWVRLPLD